jgi:hypothetical protein
MAETKSIPIIFDGEEIFIEVTIPHGSRYISTAGTDEKKKEIKLTDLTPLINTSKKIRSKITEAFSQQNLAPQEVELAFGISIELKAGDIPIFSLVKVGASANFDVKLIWKEEKKSLTQQSLKLSE